MRVAVTNLRPVWLDPTATAKVVLGALEEAARQGARVVAFGETLLPGYPIWANWTDTSDLHNGEATEAYAAYLRAAVAVDGPEVSEIVEACRDLDVFACLGIVERAPGSTYATLLSIDPARGVVGAHRKLRPTYAERLVWSPGDGHGLRAHDVDGWRVSGLNCWEHWMPQARHAMYADGTMLHVGAWPGARRLTRDITRFVALEGRVFSLAAGGVMDATSVPEGFPMGAAMRAGFEGGSIDYDGGAAVAAPDGSWLLEPTAEEGVHVVDLDIGEVHRARAHFDPAGHYARPDVFRVQVDRTRRQAAVFTED